MTNSSAPDNNMPKTDSSKKAGFYFLFKAVEYNKL